ncbi:MAG: gluconate 2-dehydrogenase subunit 3 family protein [Bryobacteraceae bacterium]
MKRRHFVQSLIAAPAVPAALVAQDAAKPVPPPAVPAAAKLETGIADEAGSMVPHFLAAEQLFALRKLGDLILPSLNGAPGAAEANAAEFLDFLIGQSSEDRQRLYRAGLDELNSQAASKFNKSFAHLENPQAETLLAPLRAAWTYEPPADPFARFLREAKQDIRTATMNSKEWVTAAASTGGRRGGGIGLYWYPLD